MITKPELIEIILSVDKWIRKYADKFDVYTKDFDRLTHNYSFITNERTVAAYSTLAIRHELIEHGYHVDISVNEFAVEFKNGIKASEFNKLRKTIKGTAKNKKWNKCYIDGFIKTKDEIYPNVDQLFIEYKMQHAFVFFDLADDFLKYRAYTLQGNAGTAFIYVVFDKIEMYPTILSDLPYYQLICGTVDESIIDENKRVFIILPKDIAGGDRRQEDIEKTIKVIDDIAALAEATAEEYELGKSDPLNEHELLFVDYLHAYNRQIIFSKTIRDNFDFLENVWNIAAEMKLFGKMEELFSVEPEELREEMIIQEGAKYRSELNYLLNSDSKQEAISNGVLGGVNVSLFLLSLVDYFCDRFTINVKRPLYGKKAFKRGNAEKEEFNWETSVNIFKGRLKSYYKEGDEGDNRLKKIVYSLLYYLIGIYHILFVFEDGKVYDYSSRFTQYELSDRLQKEIDGLLKRYKLKNMFISVDDILQGREEEAAVSRKNIALLVSRIIDAYR